jgi:hypothetical protein
MASGALGWGVSAGAGWLGVEEHPAMNPAARIATAMDRFLIIIDSPTRLLHRNSFAIACMRDHCTEPTP